MRPASLAVRSDQGRAGAEIDLGFLAWLAFEAAHRKPCVSAQAMDKPSDAEVAASEVVLCDQILIDPLGRQTKQQLLQNLSSPGLASAESSGLASGGLRGGQMGFRAEGRIGWF